ncbi:unnamed protein product [Penicillium olsonii]|nr:unnamed protein product [Penicillium olsonii]
MSPEPAPTETKAQEPEPQTDEYNTSSRKGKFRFKSSSRHSKESSRHDHSRQHRKRSHRSRTEDKSSKRRHRDPSRSKPAEPTQLPTSDAFRESLFDALGDDEGAAYWESVYGQPIHNYSVPHVQGPEGELEQMTEEEYVAYVRTRMWERTREGQLEEQERLRAERMRKKMSEEKGRAADEERRAFERAMDESLRRGAERKKFKAWGGVWKEYLERWGEMEAERVKEDPSRALRNMIFWPVRSGKRGDVEAAAVEEFMKHAPEGDLVNTLKTERIRWHPDKIQHRYGALGIDDVVMRSVTEVFQIVDRMWSEKRERQS